ncbi:MAG: S1C family serine protease [bacterium]
MRKTFFVGVMIAVAVNASFAQSFPAVEVYEDTAPAVVLIVAQKDGKGSMAGAGSFISPSGYVVTNAHVVIDKDTGKPFGLISAYLKPERVVGDLSRDLRDRLKAKVLSYDSDLDIAVLKVENAPQKLKSLILADPDEIRVGEEVVAIGHPEQGGLWSLTYGRISGEIANQSNVKGKDMFQTDTSVNRGNSGGPLLDRRGYLVGVNTNIARLGVDNLPITGVNFALKSSVVKRWLDRQGIILAYGTAALQEKESGTVPVNAETITPPSGERKAGEKAEPAAGTEKTAVQAAEEGTARTREEGGSAQVQEKADEREQEPAQPSPKAPGMEKGDSTERILTPQKPYTFDALFSEVEKEMEEMMQEMKGKIEQKKKEGLR